MRASLPAILVWAAFAAACSMPARGPCEPEAPAGRLGSICGFDRAEDLLFVPSAGVIVASSMREGGGLHGLPLESLARTEPRPLRLWPRKGAATREVMPSVGDPGCTAPPGAFHSHGLGQLDLAGGRTRVAAVSHAPRESIELFDLVRTNAGVELAWLGCLMTPEKELGNDVALARDGRVFVTSFVPRSEGIRLRVLATAASLGAETGEVLEWSAARGWREVSGTRGAGPNGLLLAPDESALYVAENGRQRVLRVPLADVRNTSVFELGYNVDNLSWTDEVTILAVLHRSGYHAVLEPCLMQWSVVEIDPDSGSVTERLRHDGDVLCDATSALRIGSRLLIGSMSETRIGVFEPEPGG